MSRGKYARAGEVVGCFAISHALKWPTFARDVIKIRAEERAALVP
jgi:hypothetical protein